MTRRSLPPAILSVVALFSPFIAPTETLADFTEANGIVVFEAENFSVNQSPRSSRSWQAESSVAGFSGTGYMSALPNSGSNISAGSTSPELQFRVTFANAGTYQIWIRGRGATADDDSCHVGINGGSAVPVTLTTTNAWQWSNRNQSTSGSATITIPSAGLHTINVWMREDGFSLDRLVLTRNSTFLPQTGNAWHIPSNAEPSGTASMRAPLYPEGAPAAITLVNGNQFQGTGGTAANQTQTSSAIIYRVKPNGVWQERPLLFFRESGNNKYFSGSIPSDAAQPGQVIEYYLRIFYSDRLPTFLHGGDSSSATAEIEAGAVNSPFSVTWRPALQPAGGEVLETSGNGFVARIYRDSGHITLGYTDRQGAAAEATVTPPAVDIGGRRYMVGQVLAHEAVDGKLLLQQDCNGTSVTSELSFAAPGVLRYEVTDWNGLAPTQILLSGASPASEQFFGLGEKFNSVNQTGRRTHILNFDQPATKGDLSYKVTPWFLSTRGYGLYLDSTAEGWFDLRSTATDRYTVESLHSKLRLHLIAGPGLDDALSRYVKLTGLPSLPPPWTFGTWISSDIWRNGGEVRYAVTKHRELGIPASVFVFDSPWSVAYNDYTWNSAQWSTGATFEGVSYAGFATPSEMLAFLRANGLKVVCWMTPFVNVSSVTDRVGGVAVPGQNTGQAANYAAGAAAGYFVRSSPGGSPLVVPWWKGSGSPVDFTNPDAATWLQDQLHNLVVSSLVGGSEPVIGGFKTDDGEYSNGTDVYIPMNASYHDGRTGLEMRNGYSVTYHRAIWNVMGSNGALFARGGFTGSQAYTAYWGGDNEPNYGPGNGLQSVIVSGLSAGLSGFSIWGHDIGGYLNGSFESNTEDLFMRWTQFGAFSPIMQMHRQVDPSNLRQYPWGYGATGLSNYRDYAKLHSRLFPYIYSYAKQAAQTGLPIMRHPALKHPDDTNTHALQHTYYFGDEMLVAPVVSAMTTTRNVYLPAGKWRDFWTGQQVTGGAIHAWSNSDRSKFPVFLREGSIVPMLPESPDTLVSAAYAGNSDLSTPDSRLEVLVTPGANARFDMHDGTTFELTQMGASLRTDVMSAEREITFKIPGTAPAGVQINGARVPALESLSAEEATAAKAHWRHDPTAGATFVLVRHQGGGFSLTTGPATASDSIPDVWKTWHGLPLQDLGNTDTDSDGLSDADEYTAGTDPRSAASSLTGSIHAASFPSGLTIRWLGTAGIRYGVEWRDSLQTPGWNRLQRSFFGANSMIEWSDDGTDTGTLPGASRFYRLIIR